MLNYFKKFAMEIVPSVAATIIGAYIVNHYIAAKPATDTPAAAVSTAKPKSDPKKDLKVDAKAEPDAKPEAEARPDEPSGVAGIPSSGIKAKGISEKGLLEKNAAAEKAVVIEKPAEKVAPAEATASLPAESRRPQPTPREKTASKPAPVAAPPVLAAAPAETAAPQDERRDANDLARAAIERLRGGETPRAPETVRAQETPRGAVAAAPAPAIVKPLPPPIVVAAPTDNVEPVAARPPYAAASRGDDGFRPTPPAEIPTAPRPPLDLRAEMVAQGAPRERTSVAEDMLTAAKSMFNSVLPKSSSN